MNKSRVDTDVRRPVLYQICRAGDRFEVGDGPFDLSRLRVLILGRGAEGGYDARANEDVIRVADPWMSSRHAALMRDGARHMVKDMGSTNGVLLNSKRVAEARLETGDLIETGRTFWVYLLLPLEPAPPIEPVSFGEMASWSPSLAATLTALSKAARGVSPILITGEQGVGKEYCAKAIHLVSCRPGRLITVDAGKLPREKHLPELLGTQDVRAGALCLSSGGTLMIHRVDALAKEAQEALLDAVAGGRVVPPNGGRPVNVDLRVVTSTEADLMGLARRGKFNVDLAEALSAVRAHLPPLRERPEDLGLLMDQLLARAGGAHAITRDAARALLNYPWPRNVRELSKVLEGGAILAGDEAAVDLRHLPGVVAQRPGTQQDVEGLVTGDHAQHQPQDPETTSPGDPGFDNDPHTRGPEQEFAATDPDERIRQPRGRGQPVPPPPARTPPPPPPPPLKPQAPPPPAAPKILGKKKPR